ncbi:alpha/beta fold hydrolase [Millisia brevis]|uniref:alpha/beta fold hydrolase n=1 Tax=Millisia brevis TaxID=264148 RepID=UPI000A9C3B91|nr:alpha/beta hydrolase [Millisia brevis]
MSRLAPPAFVGGLGSAAAVAAAAGLSTARKSLNRGRELRKIDRNQTENFDLIGADRSSVVTADDGVHLAVREVGPSDAPVTVVFVHGYCLRMQSWHFQRRALERRWGSTVRMVFYDQRGHGASGRPSGHSCTIDQLGADLAGVLRAVVPKGPIVLVGHSMGGMTVLAYARRDPETFLERVVGVGLVATAAKGLAEEGLGRNLENPATNLVRGLVRNVPGVTRIGRGLLRSAVAPILLEASFGTDQGARLDRFVAEMISDTSMVTMVDFLPSLELHDESDALPTVATKEALVVSPGADWVIPPSASQFLVDNLPKAELLSIPRAGHMVQLENPAEVSDAIDRLVVRSVQAMPDAGRRRRWWWTVG